MDRLGSIACFSLFGGALLCAGVAGANPFADFLLLEADEGRPLYYAGDTYYNAVPHIWVTSSDGMRYDNASASSLVFGITATYSLTQRAAFQDMPRTIKISGAGTAKHFDLSDGNRNYVTDYMPPRIGTTPAQACNEELAKRGASAMAQGFVLKKSGAYWIEGTIHYWDRWNRATEVKASMASDVYLLCAGGGKPTAPDDSGQGKGKPPGGDGIPEPPAPPGVPSRDLSPGFLVTSAAVSIASKFDGMKTEDCPVRVPIVLSFEGTEKRGLQYRLTSAKGGVSKTGFVQLGDGRGGRYGATREILVDVPQPGPGGASGQASGTFVPGQGGDPPPVRGPTTLGTAGGGGGAPGIGGAPLQQETAAGVHADSVRIEILEPNKLESDYAGYRIICEPKEVKQSAAVARVPLAAEGRPQEPWPTDPPSATRLPSHKAAAPKRALFRPPPVLVLGSTKKLSGQTFEIGSGAVKKNKKGDGCRVSGFEIEWPGDAKPTVRLDGQTVRPKRVTRGDVTKLGLPTLDVDGSNRLEAQHGGTTGSWKLETPSDCGPAAVARPPSDPRRAPGRSSDGRRRNQ